MLRPKPVPRRIETSKISLGEVPRKELVIKDSTGERIEKLCSHSEWQSRVLWMTAENLLISLPGEVDIADQIPLVHVFLSFTCELSTYFYFSMKSARQLRLRQVTAKI